LEKVQKQISLMQVDPAQQDKQLVIKEQAMLQVSESSSGPIAR
jgi:hypothetical protein